MPNASYLQASFIGGEWSPYAQGRADLENYRTGLNLCYNYVPLEVGAATRRPGTVFCATTRNGVAGTLREFHFSQNAPYDMEFTDGHMRLFAGQSLLLQNEHQVGNISSATPAVVETFVAHAYATGDQVEFNAVAIPGVSPLGPSPIFNRQFSITVVDTTHFSLQDPVTGDDIDGSTIDIAGWAVTVARVVDFATPYTDGIWSTIRLVQDEEVAFVLNKAVKPYVLTNTSVPTGQNTADAVFDFGLATFLDGPYLDPPTDNSTLTPSTTSGAVTLTASAITSINGGLGFESTDVGRHVRLLSEPLDWSSGSAYTTGSTVRFETGAGPAYYQALLSNSNVRPDMDNGTNWAIDTTAAAWTWGIITAFTNPTHVVVTLADSAKDVYQQPMAGGSLLYTNPIKVWRLGVYSDTTGYPSVGCFNGGRFFFAGALGNRFDTTMSNDNYRFSPTLLDGTVTDNCGMSESLKGEDINRPLWMIPAAEGVIIGTQGGEWLVQASTLNEPLTPTSIDAKKVTKYGCADAEPRNTGLSYTFIQRYQKQVFEYLADVYSRKFQGTNIARKAKHLMGSGVAEIAYQDESAPVIWARTADNRLLGCTYKRESPYSTQPASFMGWHQHTLGSGREVECIRGGPSPDGTLDSVMMVTNDTATGIRYVELLSPFFEETGEITDAWFLDAAVTPTSAEVIGTNVVFYGLQYIAGQTVAVWLGGVDAGDYIVSADGTITVPIDGSANPLLIPSLLAALTTENSFGRLGVDILVTAKGTGFFSPVGAALGYTSSSASSNYPQSLNLTIFDWANNRLYEQRAAVGGDPSNNGHTLFVFNLTTRAQVLGPVDPGDTALAGCSCIGTDGNLYFVDGAGNAHVRRYNTTTHTVDKDFTSATGGAAYCAAQEFGGVQYIVATGLNSGGGGGSSAPWWITSMGGAPATLQSGDFEEQISSIAPGNAYPAFRGPNGRTYVAVVGQTNLAGPTLIGIYVIGMDSAILGGSAKIGVIAPTDVAMGLTSLQTLFRPLYDATDGNLIIQTVDNLGVYRLVKVSTKDASVLWSYVYLGNVDLSHGRIEGGRLTFVDGVSPFTLVKLDTLTGTADTSTHETVIGVGAQASDDTLGMVVVQVGTTGATQWVTFGPAVGGGAITPAGYYTAPAVIGFNYPSKLQLLRPVTGQELQTQQGPAQGKTRRSHMHATLLVNTQGAYFGTDFTKMHLGKLMTAGRTVALANNVLFTGTLQDTLADDYGFDSMWATQTLRPYPTTIVSVEAFVHTQER